MRRRKGWIRWARQKAIGAEAVIIDGKVAAVPMPEPRAAIAARQSGPEPAQEPALEGVVLDPVAARKLARDQRFRESPDGVMMRAVMGGLAVRTEAVR